MIRAAEVKDMPRLVAMGRHFIGLTGYKNHVAENDIQMQVLARQLMSGGDSLLLVFDAAGTALGMFGGVVFAHPVSGVLVASEVFWWVEPECRGAGVALFKRFEGWARERGARKIQMVAPAGTKVGKFYERLGFAEVETLYQREIKR